MKKHIIFDMGRVLIHWSPDWIVSHLDLPAEDAKLLVREVFDNVEWVSMDRGRFTEEEGLRRICARLPQRLHEAARYCVMDWWKEPFLQTPGMAALIAELKERGYGIYLLSNATARLHEYFPRIAGSEYFDGMIVSADWKLLKPQHEIFETLFREFGLDPSECFFIDDHAPNIDGAACVGLDGTVFFNDTDRLRRELCAAGITVNK